MFMSVRAIRPYRTANRLNQVMTIRLTVRNARPIRLPQTYAVDFGDDFSHSTDV